MEKRKLILHIGSHKTATTSIQHYCHQHREYLREIGLFYPSFKLINKKEHYAHHNLAHALAGNHHDWTEPDVREFLQSIRDNCREDDVVLLSAEPFYRHVLSSCNQNVRRYTDRRYWRARDSYIKKVHDVFTEFDIEIVCVLRNQIDFFNSLYQEVIKVTNFHGTPFEFYLMKRNEFNYGKQLDSWSKYFDKIKLLSYSQLVSTGDTVKAFLESIGAPQYSLPPAHQTVNESLDPLIVELKRIINQHSIETNEKIQPKQILKTLKDLQKYSQDQGWFDSARKVSYLTPNEAQMLLVSSSTSNRNLRSSYGFESISDLNSYEMKSPYFDLASAETVQKLEILFDMYKNNRIS